MELTMEQIKQAYDEWEAFMDARPELVAQWADCEQCDGMDCKACLWNLVGLTDDMVVTFGERVKEFVETLDKTRQGDDVDYLTRLYDTWFNTQEGR